MSKKFDEALDVALKNAARARKVSVARLSKKAIAEVTADVKAQLAASKTETKKAASSKRTKRAIAADVFAGMAGDGVPRKNVVSEMVDKAGLTEAGAKNYYQRFFSGEWEVL